MAKHRLMAACACSVLALASTSPAAAQLGGGASSGAQTAPDQQPAGIQPVQGDDGPVQGADIVVTGSLIRGTPEDAALPVDVIGGEELAKQGNPTPVELLKNLPTSSAVLGDSNQFDSRSQGAEGIATANLRGLSPQRTLVLLNNKRLTTAGNGVPSVDLNLLPQAAIGRVEVLKDGAAATYGSDAIAGVVNFITRTDQEGFAASGNWRFIKDSKGDQDISLSFGHRGDGFRVLVAAGYTGRGQLLAKDRDFAIQPYTVNPQGGWTGGGNPSNFVAVGAPAVTGPTGVAGTVIRDSSCAALGGFVGAPKAGYPFGQCFNQYTVYDALVDQEKRGTGFVDFEADVGGGNTLEVTLLYGRSTVPHYLTSPSYLLTQSPSPASFAGSPFAAAGAALGASGFFVPSYNPGLVAYRAANPTTPASATGVLFPTLLFRPYLLGGNPLFAGNDYAPGSSIGLRKSETFRATAEMRGKLFSGIDYSFSVTYHDYDRYISGYDSFGDRVQRALLGYGGANCTGTTPGANGCVFLNPFGNASQANLATGATNPQYNGAVANTADLASWLFVKTFSHVDTELYVAEGQISGSTGIELPGGPVQFGVGGQYRYTWLRTEYGANNNIVTNPCRESPVNGNTNPAACSGGAAANGALGFLGTNRNSVLNGGIYAFFGELQLPIFDSLNAQLGARYEDYGGLTGSTFNPQFRARFQATPWLAFRGGVGTTFRGPTLANIDPNRVTALQLIGSAFKPVDVFGNPGLSPEKSTNYGGGVLLSGGGFSASVDYYNYKLRDAIVADPLAAMVNTLFPSTGANACNTALASRFIFANGVCGSAATVAANIANISRVNTAYQNATNISNEGLDFVVNLRNNNLFDRDIRLGVGGSATYVIRNTIGDISVAGVRVQRSYNGVGLLNYQTVLYPVPKWKGQAYVDLAIGPVDMRFQGNYTGGLHDQRADTNTGPFAPNADLGGITVRTGADIAKFVTADYNIQVDLGHNLTITGTVTNIFDRDPPFAREDYSYEPFIGNPLGRTFKVGGSIKF